jgi:crotonobetainyl-CoA:carnitine CoA-transferase CaiB-like acyl-CoA transferase
LHNLRPGVIERLGFGADEIAARHPRIIYGAISGFGMHGPALAAFDTVIQGRLGLTALVGAGPEPLRMGSSIADQLSGHFMAAGIVAALAEREHSGLGQVVSVAMVDAMAWLTQLAWNEGEGNLQRGRQLEARDGWIVTSAGSEELERAMAGQDTSSMLRAEIVRALSQRGIAAAPVLEANEVLTGPFVQRCGCLYSIETSGNDRARTLAMPLGITGTPVLRPKRMPRLGEDSVDVPGDLRRRATST